VFEAVEAAFDAVALFVEFATVASLDFAVPSAWDDGCSSKAFDLGHDRGGVIAFVGEHDLGLTAFEQMDGLGVLAGLPGCKPKGDRITQTVGQQMDLRRQSTSGTPQSLVFGAPFLRPVAACWWARTMVESSIR